MFVFSSINVTLLEFTLDNVMCSMFFFYVSIFLSQDSKHSAEIVTSPSLDVFLPEDEDNPYESVTTAVTRKPCSLDINHRLNSSPRNGKGNTTLY